MLRSALFWAGRQSARELQGKASQIENKLKRLGINEITSETFEIGLDGSEKLELTSEKLAP